MTEHTPRLCNKCTKWGRIRVTCPWYEDEIRSCTVCEAGEGTLTTKCPGSMVSDADQERICNGLLDFDGHCWVVRKYEPNEQPDMGQEFDARKAAGRLNALRR